MNKTKTPDYFLQKAKRFNDNSKNINYTSYYPNYNPDVYYDSCETKYIKQVKPEIKRYYNPINKHWYSIDSIFDKYCKNKICTDDCGGMCQFTKVEEYDEITYCECDNSFYDVEKVYNDCCNSEYKYTKLCYNPVKSIGTDYYKPNYTPCQ